MGYIISRFGIQEKGENCLYSSTRNVLYFHGLRLTEPEVYLRSMGLTAFFILPCKNMVFWIS